MCKTRNKCWKQLSYFLFLAFWILIVFRPSGLGLIRRERRGLLKRGLALDIKIILYGTMGLAPYFLIVCWVLHIISGLSDPQINNRENNPIPSSARKLKRKLVQQANDKESVTCKKKRLGVRLWIINIAYINIFYKFKKLSHQFINFFFLFHTFLTTEVDLNFFPHWPTGPVLAEVWWPEDNFTGHGNLKLLLDRLIAWFNNISSIVLRCVLLSAQFADHKTWCCC